MVALRLLLRQPATAEVLARVLPCLDSPEPNSEASEVVRYLDSWDTITGNWFLIADYLLQLDRLHHNEAFSEKERAAIVASRVYYFLNEYNEALKYALRATGYFTLQPIVCDESIGPQDELYVNKIIETALDVYRDLQHGICEMQLDSLARAALDKIVNEIFEDTLAKHDYRACMALGFNTLRLDRIDQAISRALAEGDEGILIDALMHALLTMDVTEVAERDGALDLVLSKQEQLAEPDFVRMCQAMIKLDRPEAVAKLLKRLAESGGRHELFAYQLAFDLFDAASQQFTRACVRHLKADTSPAEESTSMENMETDAQETTTSESKPEEPVREEPKKEEKQENPIIDNIEKILKGHETVKQHMQFLIKNNKTDPQVLKIIKDSVRSSVPHNAACLANGIMQCGTTCDDFLRDNLEWVSKATNWNKFNAVASLGNIHKGHEDEAMRVLQLYLPQAAGGGDSAGYKEGGALYALGLIHANHGTPTVINYLVEQLSAAQTPPLKHGACLGLGLAAMGTHDRRVYLKLRDVLYTDDAIASMAAAYAMGLVYCGTHSSVAIEEPYAEMTQYMSETQHGRIKEGLRVGISFLWYGRGQAADAHIDTLLSNSASVADRQTGVLCIAMAYAGTGDATQVQKLLTRVATDPNHDLKRLAAMSIGFIMLRNPEGCLSYTRLMLEHFNGNVRYGALMAIGIASSATGNKDTIAVVEPLLNDKDAYVRQGAAIALSLIMIQQNEVLCPRQKPLREKLQRMIGEKNEDQIVKFGGILALGIMDAGGRNVTVSLMSRATHDADMAAVVGMLLFTQHFFWHTLVPCIALTFKPTCVIGLNKRLQMPKIRYHCAAPASRFAYVPPIETKQAKDTEKVETAVLSFTNRVTKKKQDKQSAPKTPTTTPAESTKPSASASPRPTSPTPIEVDEALKDAKQQEDKKREPSTERKGGTETESKEEQNFHTLYNPARAMPEQLALLSIDSTDEASQRYKPMKPLTHGGIIMLDDSKPNEEEALVQHVPAGGVPQSESVIDAAERKTPPPTFNIPMAKYLSKN